MEQTSKNVAPEQEKPIGLRSQIHDTSDNKEGFVFLSFLNSDLGVC